MDSKLFERMSLQHFAEPEKVVVNTVEDIGKVLTKFNKTLDGAKAKAEEVVENAISKEAFDEYKKEQEEAKTADEAKQEQLLEKIRSLTLATESKGNWKTQDTPEAKAYGLGKLYMHMFQEAVHGSKIAGPNIIKMGCSPARPGVDHGWESKEGEQRIRQEVFLDPREGMTEEEKAGLSSSPLTGDDSVGSYNASYVIPVEYRAELERIALDNSAMMGKVRSFPVPGITSYLPISTDELAFTAVTNQNTDKTEETLTLGRTTLTTVTYAAYLAVVEEFMEDALIEIGGIIRDMFGEAWGKKFDTLCLSDSTYGAINTTNINAKVMSAGNSSFDSIGPEDLHSMVQELDSRWKRSGGEFYMHPTVWDYLELAKNADGDYYFGPPSAARPLSAWGRPVTLTDGMPDSGDSAASTSFVAFGNPRRIVNGFRVGFEFKIYAETQSAMESGQIFLRARTRQAFALSLPTTWVDLTTAA